MAIGRQKGIPLRGLPEKMHLETYSQDGQILSDRIITDSDVVYRRLSTLIESEQGIWGRSITSHKTGPYIIRSDYIIFRCYSDELIIDVFDTGRWKSIKKNLPNLLHFLDLPPSYNSRPLN